MKQYTHYFKDKHITVMGLGLLGRGVGDARFLAEQGAKVLVTDLKTEDELRESVEQLKEYENISFVLGGHREEDFAGKDGENVPDMVIKAAGVPFDSPYVQAAQNAGVSVTMSTALFAKLTPATIIGITGTRGKSTVTHLVADILEASGKNVFRGGNVQGVSTLEHLPESTEGEVAVLELDSWQLQGFSEEKISPHIAVFATFKADHMNYYTSTGLSTGKAMDRYLEDKANIFKYQTADDLLVLGEQCAEIIQEKYSNIKSNVGIASANDVPDDWSLPLPGEHNRSNIACALKAVESFDIPSATIRQAVENFKSVPGRLESIGLVSGVEVYNDNNATTPDATVVALSALRSKASKSVVLIAGGADKGLETNELLEAIQKYCRTVVWLPGTGTDRIKDSVEGVETFEVKNMQEAVEKAFDKAEETDTVLFSPAFASFGLFKNEYDRGEKFLQEIQEL